MPLFLRVTLQAIGRRPSAELPLAGAGHTSSQHLFGNIPAVHIVQDVLKRRDVQFRAGQAVYAVCHSDISYIVFWEKDFDISACFNVVTSQSGEVFGNDAAHFPRLNISDHPPERGAVER